MTSQYFMEFEQLINALEFIGLWPSKESSLCYKIYCIISHLIGIDFMTFCQIVCLLTVENIQQLLDVMSMALLYVLITIKSLNLIIRIEKLNDLMKMRKAVIDYSDMKESSVERPLNQRLNRIKKIYKIYFGITLFCILLSIPMTLVRSFSSPPYVLFFMMWSPVDYESSLPLYLLLSSLEIASCMAYIILGIGMDYIFTNFITTWTGIFEELGDRLEAFAEESKKKHDFKKLQQQLYVCMNIHQKVTAGVEMTEDFFGGSIFLQGFLTSQMLCTCLYALTTASIITSLSDVLLNVAFSGFSS